MAAAPKEYQVHCKVGLWGLVENLNREDWPKIAQKQLDFVLYDPERNLVVLVIELDDASHCNLDAQKRDAAKNAILAEAGIPVLRVRAASRYDVSALWVNIKAHIK